jgi:hypothetical protein
MFFRGRLCEERHVARAVVEQPRAPRVGRVARQHVVAHERAVGRRREAVGVAVQDRARDPAVGVA